MLGQPEHLAGVHADPLEDAISVQEPMVVYGNLRRVAVVPLSVEPDRRHAFSRM